MKNELRDVLFFTFIVLLITTFSAISNSMVYGNKYGGNMTFIMSIYPIVSAILVEKGFNIKTIVKDKLNNLKFWYNNALDFYKCPYIKSYNILYRIFLIKVVQIYTYPIKICLIL